MDFKSLPVWQHRKEILDGLAGHQVIVVESPTGSGKTTQLPLILKEAGYADALSIGITQPRRIATLSVCDFIKRQLGDQEGSYVGYKMRFSDTTTPSTRVKIMTDGILLQELKADPLLKSYSVIVVDEAHERSLNIDFILGLLKGVLSQREDFKVIISSATINTKAFSHFFDDCPVVSIQSQVYPVKIFYQPVNPFDTEKMNETIWKIVKSRKGKGDILIFQPGEFDITRTVSNLLAHDPNEDLVIYPLYARLSKEQQEAVFTPTPPGKTKVVVATNIAETSITIDGITTVIDSGIAKINFYNQKNFTSALEPLPVSKSSAEQRKGRAGRTRAGVCYRLYGEKDFESRFSFTTEEILRTDLSEVVLRMSDLGIYDYEHFPFITRPKNSAIQSAEATLRFIGAIDETRHLTRVGELMCKFPLLPRHSRVIVESLLRYPDVLEQVLVAVAFLSSKTPFLFPADEEEQARAAQRSFSDARYGDFVTFLHVYERYLKAGDTLEKKQAFCHQYYLDYQCMQEIVHVTEQLGDICGEIGFPLSHSGTPKEYLICIASGLSQYICIKSERNVYQSLTAGQIFIHPGSAYFRILPKFIIAGEIVETSRMYARSVSPLEESWLDEIQPGLAKRLTDMVRGRKDDDAYYQDGTRKAHMPVEGDYRKGNDVMTIYRHKFETVHTSGKKGMQLVVIPAGELSYLAQQHKKATKRAKNFPATLQVGAYYVEYPSKFYTLLDLDGKIPLHPIIYDNVPKGAFTIDQAEELANKLDCLLQFVKSHKDRRVLCFIQLEGSGDSFRFTQSRDFGEALDTSLFSLGDLIDRLTEKGDDTTIRIAKKARQRLLKLAD